MASFSFLCKESGKPVLCVDGGDAVYMFLLEDGEVVEEMHGNYNSYGCVFDGKGGSFAWSMDWGDVCLSHDWYTDGSDVNGIAVVLAEHYTGARPTTISQTDPDQGCMWSDEPGAYDTHHHIEVEHPYHKVYKKGLTDNH